MRNILPPLVQRLVHRIRKSNLSFQVKYCFGISLPDFFIKFLCVLSILGEGIFNFFIFVNPLSLSLSTKCVGQGASWAP
jgi:hypothetical protein